MSRARRGLAIVLGAGAVAGAVAGLVYFSGQPPGGPVAVAWDREVCAECRMHVSDRRFAAQLQTQEGDVLVFDDPGCAFVHIERNRPRVYALYFHHMDEERWIPAAEVAFVRAAQSPMGYDLGALASGTPGAMSLEEASAAVRSRALARGLAP